MSSFNVYKGLQKPLIFRGFKGRYIAWGIGSIILGVVSAGIIGVVFNLIAGFFALVTISVGGIFYTSIKQKGGLYDKKRSNGEIYIIPNNIKYTKHVKKKKV